MNPLDQLEEVKTQPRRQYKAPGSLQQESQNQVQPISQDNTYLYNAQQQQEFKPENYQQQQQLFQHSSYSQEVGTVKRPTQKPNQQLTSPVFENQQPQQQQQQYPDSNQYQEVGTVKRPTIKQNQQAPQTFENLQYQQQQQQQNQRQYQQESEQATVKKINKTPQEAQQDKSKPQNQPKDLPPIIEENFSYQTQAPGFNQSQQLEFDLNQFNSQLQQGTNQQYNQSDDQQKNEVQTQKKPHRPLQNLEFKQEKQQPEEQKKDLDSVPKNPYETQYSQGLKGQGIPIEGSQVMDVQKSVQLAKFYLFEKEPNTEKLKALEQQHLQQDTPKQMLEIQNVLLSMYYHTELKFNEQAAEKNDEQVPDLVHGLPLLLHVLKKSFQEVGLSLLQNEDLAKKLQDGHIHLLSLINNTRETSCFKTVIRGCEKYSRENAFETQQQRDEFTSDFKKRMSQQLECSDEHINVISIYPLPLSIYFDIFGIENKPLNEMYDCILKSLKNLYETQNVTLQLENFLKSYNILPKDFDKDFNQYYSKNYKQEERGYLNNQPFHYNVPPIYTFGYALQMKGRYGSDGWLKHRKQNREARDEWIVMYSHVQEPMKTGAKNPADRNKMAEETKQQLYKGQCKITGKEIGRSAELTDDFMRAALKSPKILVKGQEFRLVFQNKIKPEALRQSSTDSAAYYVERSADVRPYRILLYSPQGKQVQVPKDILGKYSTRCRIF